VRAGDEDYVGGLSDDESDDWWRKQLGRRRGLRDDDDSPAELEAESHARDSQPERQSAHAAPSTGAEDGSAREQAVQMVAAAEATTVELRPAAEREASDTREQARRDADRLWEGLDHEIQELHDLAERLSEEARAASARTREDADRRATERLPPQGGIRLPETPETHASRWRRLRVADGLRRKLYALRFSPREPYRGIRRACAYLVLGAFVSAFTWLLLYVTG
jgi:hypothetical protein